MYRVVFIALALCALVIDASTNEISSETVQASDAVQPSEAIARIPSNSAGNVLLNRRRRPTNPAIEVGNECNFQTFSGYADNQDVPISRNPMDLRDITIVIDERSMASRVPKPMEGEAKEEKSLQIDDEIFSQIPEVFIVSESSGVYEFDESTTSTEGMLRRSELYRLLHEIQLFFDAFNLEGFREFLREYPAALNHQSLRYYLVETLSQLITKTSAEESKQLLLRFIGAIDAACLPATVGKGEKDFFTEFKSRVKYNVFTKGFLENEKKRINPLEEAISADDYEAAKRIIEGSNRRVWLSISDFLVLLNRPNSDSRYVFMKWAIKNGHFNIYERYKKKLWTPLMLMAMHHRCSNDIIKAILEQDPSAVNDTDSRGRNAHYYAASNDLLSKKHRTAMIKILQLNNPTVELIDRILTEN